MSIVKPSGSDLVSSAHTNNLESLSSQPKVGTEGRVDALSSFIIENGVYFNPVLAGASAVKAATVVEEGTMQISTADEDWEEVEVQSEVAYDEAPKIIYKPNPAVILQQAYAYLIGKGDTLPSNGR